MDTGVYTWGQLTRLAPRAEIDQAIADGMLIRLRHGWYRSSSADKNVAQAVLLGGILTCASALKMHGVWVPPQLGRLHIRGNDRSARDHPNWCRQHGRQPPESEAVDELIVALRHAARCLPPEEFVVVCDSIVNKGLMTRDDILAEFAGRSQRFQRILDKIDGRAESGIETMVRLRLQALNIHAAPQVTIPFVGRVDLLVGTSLIVETDGAEYHTSKQAYENDRLRDLQAHALGYHPIRLTYDQVLGDWDRSLRLILEVMHRGQHLQTPEISPLT